MLLKRERLVMIASLVGVVILAWIYLVYLASGMGAMNGAASKIGSDISMSGTSMPSMSMPILHSWGWTDLWITFVMWVVMMVAMMTPSAAPMLMTYNQLSRKRNPQSSALSSTWLFFSGYLVVWVAFSLLATLAQWGLHSAALLTPSMSSASPILGGGLLIAAGIYQFTPLKTACLSNCRTPLGFLLSEWRDSRAGALSMGLRHGVDCVGCCWMLMALLFVGGVMNLLWVAALAAYILIEKVTPGWDWLNRLIGGLAIAWGAWLVAGVAFFLR